MLYLILIFIFYFLNLRIMRTYSLYYLILDIINKNLWFLKFKNVILFKELSFRFKTLFSSLVAIVSGKEIT